MKFRIWSGSFSILLMWSLFHIPFAPPACAQIQLLGSCELPQFSEFLEIQGNYAYVSGQNEILSIVDISDPFNPGVVCNYDSTDFSWGLDIEGDYAYIANAAHGLHIIDISDPLDPALAAVFDGEYWEHDLMVIGSTAYLLTCSYLYIIDISDPTSPLEIGETVTNSMESTVLYVSDNFAYVNSAYQAYGIRIIDISDPQNPQLRGFYDSEHSSSDIIVRNDYAYIVNDRRLYILDVSDPDNPNLLNSYYINYYVKQMYISGDYLFLALSSLGFRILDISDPAYPAYVDGYHIHGEGNNDIEYRDGLIYALRNFHLDILAFGSVGIDDDRGAPDKISLIDSYPNPFNASTTISYSLPEQSDVRIEIYNILGEKIATLLEGKQDADEHSTTWNASSYPSGVYFARLHAGRRSESVKMVLLK